MATSKTPSHPCWICGKNVRLEECKIDEHGATMHEECYVVRLRFLKTEEAVRCPRPSTSAAD